MKTIYIKKKEKEFIETFNLKRLSIGWKAEVWMMNKKGERKFLEVAFRTKKQIIKGLNKSL